MECASPVYPRWRGEHVTTDLYGFPFDGLSPLARGTRIGSPALTVQCRFIPAGAGNTGYLSVPERWKPVYPRWRGEHARNGTSICFHPGLSPLARGTRLAGVIMWRCLRFIPAGAGNTDGR